MHKLECFCLTKFSSVVRHS